MTSTSPSANPEPPAKQGDREITPTGERGIIVGVTSTSPSTNPEPFAKQGDQARGARSITPTGDQRGVTSTSPSANPEPPAKQGDREITPTGERGIIVGVTSTSPPTKPEP